jgi:hypothetical protein
MVGNRASPAVCIILDLLGLNTHYAQAKFKNARARFAFCFLLLQAKATGEPSCRRNGLVLFCDLSGWLQLAKAKGTVGYSQGYTHPQGTG